MFSNKKGISEVVSSVLLILLVLAAVFIMFGFVRNSLDKTGQKIDFSSACLTTEVKPTLCTNESITVQLTKQGDLKVTRIVGILTNSSGSKFVGNATAPTEVLNLVKVPILGAGAGTFTASVAAVIQAKDASSEYTCDEAPIKITC